MSKVKGQKDRIRLIFQQNPLEVYQFRLNFRLFYERKLFMELKPTTDQYYSKSACIVIWNSFVSKEKN